MNLLLRQEFILHVTGSNGMNTNSNSSSIENRYVATPLGRATALSGLSPSDAVVVLGSLLAARTRLVLRSGLHAVFLSTPPHTGVQPAWDRFERLVAMLLKDYPVSTDYN